MSQNKLFLRTSKMFNEESYNRFVNSTVCVVGLGGVGGICCEVLVRSGLENIIICDFDKVDITNCNRQIIATSNNIGNFKALEMEKRIKEINPNCNVIVLNEKFDSNSKLFSFKIDYLVDCIDDVSNKFLLIKSCYENNIPFISSMGTAKKLDLKKLNIIDINQTTYDPLAKAIRYKLKTNNLKIKFKCLCSTEQPLDVKEDYLASYMPVTSTAGIMIADYVIKELIKEN